jgi:hypothetical protein
MLAAIAVATRALRFRSLRRAHGQNLGWESRWTIFVMSRPAKVLWNAQKRAWCTEVGGARRILAKGKANKKLAREKLRELLDEQAVLADVNGAITVAALCDAFLEDALQELRTADV